MKLASIILAAGQGTRMKSKLPKVLHKVANKQMVKWVIDSAQKSGAQKNIVVIGHGGDMVKEALLDGTSNADFAEQDQQLGTGHALKCGIAPFIDEIKNGIDYIIVLYGDTPLIRPETLKEAIEVHKSTGDSATVLTAKLENPFGYGRIVRDGNGNFIKIVEQKDASSQEKKINEINSGMYVYTTKDLLHVLDEIKNNNAQGEYYITDTFTALLEKGKSIGLFQIEDTTEIWGINDKVQLESANQVMKNRINEYHMRQGVIMVDKSTVYIEDGVKIGQDTTIYPNVIIKSGTKIGENAFIGSNTTIDNSIIDDNVTINNSTILDSHVKFGAKVGPFAYIRPNSVIGENAKIGDFVEVKNSTIGEKTSISHLTYIGDSDVGKYVNFGCGTVTVNYDGAKKYRSTVGDYAFIGCNTNLVSPVNIGAGAYTAAGSTITDDVPENALAIARARQVIKSDWNDRRKNK